MFDIFQDLSLWQQKIFIRTNITIALILWMALGFSLFKRKNNHKESILKSIGICMLLCMLWFVISCAQLQVNGSVVLSGLMSMGGVVLSFLGIRQMERYLGIRHKPRIKNRKK